MAVELDEVVKVLAKPLLALQAEATVYVARCCDKVLVSTAQPQKCGTCNQTVEYREVVLDDLL
jgi:hypothetical protein